MSPLDLLVAQGDAELARRTLLVFLFDVGASAIVIDALADELVLRASRRLSKFRKDQLSRIVRT